MVIAGHSMDKQNNDCSSKGSKETFTICNVWDGAFVHSACHCYGCLAAARFIYVRMLGVQPKSTTDRFKDWLEVFLYVSYMCTNIMNVCVLQSMCTRQVSLSHNMYNVT